MCPPKNSKDFENDVDLIIFRNTGLASGFEGEYESFVKNMVEMLSKSLIEKYQKIHLFVKLIFVIILFSLKNV